MTHTTTISAARVPLERGIKKNLSYDLPAGLVVFLIALPLCLGIAQASGAPLIAGLVAGTVGGLIVGALSGSQVSVSGPAAGLTLIVADAIKDLGSFEFFLTAVVLSGIFQLILGTLRAGSLGDFVPHSVIKGMLAAIGLVIILKQIPHALGRDADYEGDLGFSSLTSSDNTLTGLWNAASAVHPGALVISLISLFLAFFWTRPAVQRIKVIKKFPLPLAIIILGLVLNESYLYYSPLWHLEIGSEHLVSLPDFSKNGGGLWSVLPQPNFAALEFHATYVTALILAIVASIESLLSLEAADRIDPFRRISSTSQELKAQGVGNLISGLLGGLPVTNVVIRTSANVYAGAHTRMSAVFHGFLLLTAVIVIPGLLNRIPLSSLAIVLIVTGFQLTRPKIFRDMFHAGRDQSIPFFVTLFGIVFSDLLIGILIGLAAGLFFVLRANYHSAITVATQESYYLFRFNKDMTFLNKAELKEKLAKVPNGSNVIMDGTRAMIVDHDVADVIADFAASAPHRGITVELKHVTTRSKAFEEAFRQA